jgi:hypothetical protein
MDPILYGLITSNVWRGETDEEMLAYVMAVRSSLVQEADLLGLDGAVRDVHVVIDIVSLETLGEAKLIQYCDAWQMDFEGSQKLMNIKLKRLELQRYYRYVNSVLFGSNRSELTNSRFTWYEIPSVDEVLDCGPDYYFVRAGSATIESLTDRFAPYELCTLCSLLSAAINKKFVLGDERTIDEVAGMCMSCLESMYLDPRAYLTLEGPLVVHRDVSYNLLKLDPVALKLGITEHCLPCADIDKIDTNAEVAVAGHHRLVSKLLCDKFFITLEPTRPFAEQVSWGEWDLPDPLYWGTGEGITDTYRAYSQTELSELWGDMKSFCDPFDEEVPFPVSCVRSLLNKDIDIGLRSTIQGVLSQHVGGSYVSDISEGADASRKDLMLLFNAGSVLSNCMVEMMTVSYEDWELRVPKRYMPPIWRNRARLNISGILNRLLTEMDAPESLWRLDLDLSSSELRSDTGDFNNTVAGTARMLLKAIDLGLYDIQSYYGNSFMATAEWYYKKLHGMSIVDQTMKITED